jgi:hypothetical protein
MEVHTLEMPGFDRKSGTYQLQVSFTSDAFLLQRAQKLPNEEVCRIRSHFIMGPEKLELGIPSPNLLSHLPLHNVTIFALSL